MMMMILTQPPHADPSLNKRTHRRQMRSSTTSSILNSTCPSTPKHIQVGMATVIHTGIIFWEQHETPSNFSFFLISLQSSNMMSDTVDTIALSLKAFDGHICIDSEDIHHLKKHNIFIPTSIGAPPQPRITYFNCDCGEKQLYCQLTNTYPHFVQI